MEFVKKILSPPTIRNKNVEPSTEQLFMHNANQLNHKSSKYFGVPLAELTLSEVTTIPKLLINASQFIIKYGLDHEGIFRTNGNARLVEQLKNNIDDTHDITLNIEHYDVMTVASLFKLYLRELPDSLISNDMATIFLQLQASNPEPSKLFQSLKHLVQRLPVPNRDTLKHVIHLLVVVNNNESINKMSASSIGIVFGPNIFRCEINKQTLMNKLVENFILGYSKIFGFKHESYNTKQIQTPPMLIKLEKEPRTKTYDKNTVKEYSSTWENSSISNELLTASISLQDCHFDNLDMNDESKITKDESHNFINGEISIVIIENLIGDLDLNDSDLNQSKTTKSINNNGQTHSTSHSILNCDFLDKEIRSLSKIINGYKKNIKNFEEDFEKENGIKPTKKKKVPTATLR